MLPQKHIHTEIDIEAPPTTVWTILTNNKKYSEWNPYHVSVNGQLKPGQRLEIVLHKPNGEVVKIEPHVMRVEPMRELAWGGGIKGIFHGEHVFLLREINSRGTRLIQKEDFTGIAIPFASLDAIEEGYTQMNNALKRQAESAVRQAESGLVIESFSSKPASTQKCLNDRSPGDSRKSPGRTANISSC
jgi:hypothetical protein